jgi:hypothetical protein
MEMVRAGFVGVLLLIGAGVLFLQEQARHATTLEFARTVVVNALVMGEIAYLLNARFFHAPSWTIDGLFGNKVVLLAIGLCLAFQLLFIYAPFMNRLSGTAPLDAMAWLYCLGVGDEKEKRAEGEFEIRPDIDWNKGEAVRWLLQRLARERPGLAPLYVGDDITDEDAFRRRRGSGARNTVMTRNELSWPSLRHGEGT